MYTTFPLSRNVVSFAKQYREEDRAAKLSRIRPRRTKRR